MSKIFKICQFSLLDTRHKLNWYMQMYMWSKLTPIIIMLIANWTEEVLWWKKFKQSDHLIRVQFLVLNEGMSPRVAAGFCMRKLAKKKKEWRSYYIALVTKTTKLNSLTGARTYLLFTMTIWCSCFLGLSFNSEDLLVRANLGSFSSTRTWRRLACVQCEVCEVNWFKFGFWLLNYEI